MALDPTVLADGQLPNSKGTLYTAAKITIVKTISFVNTDTVTRLCNLYLNTSGTSRLISPKNLSMPTRYKAEFDDPICLEVGDLIEGDADAATVVDYIITGAIRP